MDVAGVQHVYLRFPLLSTYLVHRSLAEANYTTVQVANG